MRRSKGDEGEGGKDDDVENSIHYYAKINSYGSGGMVTKLEAASICMNAGCYMFIGNGNKTNPIKHMIEKKIFTKFVPKISTLDARKKWIVSSLSSNGTIFIDSGASIALKNGKSLLAAGIKSISGKFDKGENVIIADDNNNKLAPGEVRTRGWPEHRSAGAPREPAANCGSGFQRKAKS